MVRWDEQGVAGWPGEGAKGVLAHPECPEFVELGRRLAVCLTAVMRADSPGKLR